MKERGILFSAPMVRAILDGRKTMTRRIADFPPDTKSVQWVENEPCAPGGRYTGWAVECGAAFLLPRTCPHGATGDRLWVRETWAEVEPLSGGRTSPGDHLVERPDGPATCLWYRADGEIPVVDRLFDDGPRWRPPIYMPRWASRLTLEITEVRVQRLQDISEEDARAEGLSWAPDAQGCDTWGLNDVPGSWQPTARAAFAVLWNSMHLDRSARWLTGEREISPWVWVISFRRVNT